MKKVLIFNPYWDTLGGGERYVASLAKLLLDRKWRVDILCSKNFSSQIIKRFDIDISAASWVAKVYDSNLSRQYDLLFYVSDGSLPVSLAKRTVIHLQFPFQDIGGKNLMNFLKSRFYTFVVNSHFTRSFIDREFLVGSQVVYPPVDISAFRPGKKTNTILYVGRFSNLTQSKGHGTLVEAFSHISKMLKGWRLVLAGGAGVGLDDRYMQELVSRTSHLPVDIITDPDFETVKKLYSRSRLFWSASGYGINEKVSPTKVEHFGITAVESMAAGCVPLLSRLGGHKEIVEDGLNGFLWSSLSDLEQKTLSLVNSPDLELFSLAAQKKSKIFSISNFNQSFARLLHL